MTAVKESGFFSSDSRLSYPVMDWDKKTVRVQLADTTIHAKKKPTLLIAPKSTAPKHGHKYAQPQCIKNH